MSVRSNIFALSQSQFNTIVSQVVSTIGSSGGAYQVSDTFTTLINGTNIGDLAYINNSEGTRWLPGTLLGTYYPSGWYRWNGTNWVSDRNAIAEQLQILIDQKVQSVTGSLVDNTDPLNPIINIPASSVYGTELNLFQENTVTTNIGNTLVNKFDVNTTILPIGEYKIKINYSWNLNSTRDDFESYFFINDNSVGIDITGLIHKQEPKDQAGNFNGTESLQKMSFSKDLYYTSTIVQSINLKLGFNSNNNNKKASMFDASIELIRIN